EVEAVSALERLVRRDRAVAAAALLLLSALAWWSLVHMRSEMGTTSGVAMPGMTMPEMGRWSPTEVFQLFLMWATMMVAMMLPSPAPRLLRVAGLHRRRRERAGPAPPTALFAAGYLLVWTVFSAVAATAQDGLHRAALLSPEMASTSPILGGILLIVAGV